MIIRNIYLLVGTALLFGTSLLSQCRPTSGLFFNTLQFMYNAVYSANPYTLTRTATQIEVQKSGVSLYVHHTPTGYSSSYLIYGTSNNYLLIEDVKSDVVQVTIVLILVNLADTSPAEHVIENRTLFVSDRPQLNVQPSAGNGQALFSFIGTSGAISQILDAEIRCSDNGIHMCGVGPFTPTQQVIAEATASTVRIKEGGNIKAECPFPAPNITVQPSSLSFGTITAGTSSAAQSVTVQNTGAMPLNFTATLNNAMYSASPMTAIVAPGAFQQLNVKFSPPSGTPAGTQNGALTLTHNDTSKPNQNVTLTASVAAAIANISVTPTVVGFGTVMAGTSSSQSLTIRNNGAVPLTFAIAITNAIFSASPVSGNISAGSSQTVTVKCSPPSGTATGLQSGTLSVTHNDPNKPAQIVSITVSVTAAGPILNISATSLSFGTITSGTSSAAQNITIRNNGILPLTFTISASNAMFSASPMNASVSAGSAQLVAIKFSPPLGTPAGVQNGTLSIAHNDPSKPVQNVGLSASVKLPTPVIAVGTMQHYQTPQGRFVRYPLPVQNWQAYPAELFAPAPDLPACGLNKNASRTWVDIYKSTGQRIYGFCALGKPQDLQNIWFAVSEGTQPPQYVYVVLTDRRTNVTYHSNTVSTY